MISCKSISGTFPEMSHFIQNCLSTAIPCILIKLVFTGFMQYVLFNVPNLGFLQESMDALVDGITEAVRRAHVSVVPGSIYLRLEEHMYP